jgi:hypothetical protein
MKVYLTDCSVVCDVHGHELPCCIEMFAPLPPQGHCHTCIGQHGYSIHRHIPLISRPSNVSTTLCSPAQTTCYVPLAVPTLSSDNSQDHSSCVIIHKALNNECFYISLLELLHACSPRTGCVWPSPPNTSYPLLPHCTSLTVGSQ